jgi:hypothetical protein
MVAHSAQPTPRSSGTRMATGSSSERRPACASLATTVATIGLVSDPGLKRASGVTGFPLLTSVTP